ncbi:MAG: hypothetical protein JWQ55_6160, partial [Rhodopila sp.]|nr:hypothetical protein [Rhodopila sp.]
MPAVVSPTGSFRSRPGRRVPRMARLFGRLKGVTEIVTPLARHRGALSPIRHPPTVGEGAS